mgnify:CR=1 FL=1
MTSYTANIVRKIEQSRNEGKTEGRAELASLIPLLLKNKRYDDLEKAALDENVCTKLCKEFNINI